ncbi:hypothetical protein [Salibacterium aidingense]|uniref:hypothetical protein n=1 Tax=Salibacterium aidingense TaxID=384933 RepID=UPI00041E13F5|nr:hypothetical protein [Salibacterium aidingense]
MNRKSIGLITMTSLALMVVLFAFQPGEAAAITNDITSNTSDLTNAVDTAGSDFVTSVRSIAIVVAAALVLWMGFSLLFSGNAQSLANMKYRTGSLVLALILAFKTEMVLSWGFGIFGVDVPSFIFPFLM